MENEKIEKVIYHLMLTIGYDKADHELAEDIAKAAKKRYDLPGDHHDRGNTGARKKYRLFIDDLVKTFEKHYKIPDGPDPESIVINND